MSETSRGPGGIFDYLDYREFLREHYAARKRASPSFSYRYIAGKLGMDPGSLSGVFKGRRKLDPLRAPALAQVFGLDEYERDYFEALVLYCQAKGRTEGAVFLEKVLRLRGTRVKASEGRQSEFHRKWYHAALRELLSCVSFQGDFPKLGKLLRPAITPQETREAVQLLLELGLVEKDGAGTYKATRNPAPTGDGVRTAVMNNLHRSLAGLASRAIVDFELPERDFTALTLHCSMDAFPEVKAILRQARRDIQQRVRKDPRSNGVIQINFQAFSLSKRFDQEEP